MLLKIDEVKVEYIKEKVGRQKPKKVLDVGCEDQTYTLTKLDREVTLKVCGWKLGVYDELSEIYELMQQSKSTVARSVSVLVQKLREQEEVKRLLNTANHTFGVVV